MKNGLTFKTTKKYPRVTAGPLRHKYVHRIVAAALIGRELTKDEEVHHKDGNRLNFNWDNLMVLGSKDHGWVSSKQNWYMKEHDFLLKQQWDDYMDEEYKRFDADVALAKANGVPYNVEDGQMRERFEGTQH
jgi:hypothetical protein